MSTRRETDDDGFRIIKSKRSNKSKHTIIPPKDKEFIKIHTKIDIEKATGRLSTAVEELKYSKYYEDVSKSVSTLIRDQHIVEIVCFGLGNIGECVTSRFQLALLLLLKDLLIPEKVLVHDPIFNKDECKILENFGLEVIVENQEGSYVISDKALTLVYLPHCPLQLVNNFLWSNWGPNLSNCILVCNSFTCLNDQQPSKALSELVPYIYKILPYTKEVELENNFKYTDIFNNTSVHTFPEENLNKVEPTFWLNANKTLYGDNSEIITSLMVEKLDI